MGQLYPENDEEKNHAEKKKKKIRFDISVWVATSAMIVLVVILGMMIFMQFQQREIQAETLFVEKGATLIRSFRGGAARPADCEKDVFYLQKLLMETAQQPDIDYIIVTDSDGQYSGGQRSFHAGQTIRTGSGYEKDCRKRGDSLAADSQSRRRRYF